MIARMITALSIAVLAVFTIFSGATSVVSDAKAGAALNQDQRQRIIIGLDLSMSNPLVSDSVYAAKLAERVADEIRNLAPRSEVWVRSFGAYDSSSNPLRFNETISARNRPEVVAEGVRTLVSNLPTLVDRGVVKGQPSTNIVAFLENMTHVVDCADGVETRFILLTDGIEESEYADLRNPKSHLPINAMPVGARCGQLQILGLGQGMNSPRETQRLRREWSTWAAGDDTRPFLSFIGLNDW